MFRIANLERLSRRVSVPLLATAAVVFTGVCPDAFGQASGSVISWGLEVIPYVETGARFSAISAGYAHSLALKNGGTVVAWGGNALGQSTVPPGLSGVTAIAAGGWSAPSFKEP